MSSCLVKLVSFRSWHTLVRSLSTVNYYTERTHTCGQLTERDIGDRVSLFGWVQNSRFDNLIIELRDRYGITQCILNQNLLTKSFRQQTIPNESVIQVSGIVRKRPKNQELKHTTGAIEVGVDQIKIISKAKTDLLSPNERLMYIRSPAMQETLAFRSEVVRILCDKLYDLKFIYVETPTLCNQTPGGADEFIVPTRYPGEFYSLAQSPQQLKQLLMVGCLDRYFQLARCYRDESNRSDRQPEFTQLDIELSFTNEVLIMQLINNLLHHLVVTVFAGDDVTKTKLTSCFDSDKQLKTITHADAFRLYGTDKPDTRFDWLISDTEPEAICLDVPHLFGDDELKQMIDDCRTSIRNQNRSVVVQVAFERDLMRKVTRFRINETSTTARELLGSLRLSLAEKLVREKTDVYKSDYQLVWITDIPLFKLSKQTNKLVPSHHPFTAPTEATIHLLETNPLGVVGRCYDLVLNGCEVAGGSVRIHEADLQQKIFTDTLEFGKDSFEKFIKALQLGCPVHGGIAIGIERLVALLLGRGPIRDVIAFPKTNSGRDPTTGCPEKLGRDVLERYHLKQQKCL